MRSKKLLPALVLGLLAVVGARVALAGGGPAMAMGKTTHISQKAFQGYYDGHKDTYLNLDSSSKAEARAEHINYAPGLKLVSLKTPEIYFVTGSAATGQLAVLGSEPGEKDYSPVWHEVHVSFKSGQTPVLIKSDTQIDSLEKQGMLGEQKTSIRLNCPVVRVAKG